MKLQDILEQWKVDSQIDVADLMKEGEKIYVLHAKYLSAWSDAKLQLKALKLQLATLQRKKHEFFLQGPSTETKEWEYPASGKIIRTDIDLYKSADKQIQELEFKIENAQVKVDTYKYIMDAINQRVYVINNLIKLQMYQGM